MFDVRCSMFDVSGFVFCCALLLAVLASGTFASAQSNGVPGPTDYAAFSRFVTTRNIFDPNRYARSSPRSNYRPRVSRSAPAFTLVGTMCYEKGMFAFFDGNNSDLRKVLCQPDTNGIAGYVATDITLDGVKLQSADKKETVEMKIGEMMRQEGGHWQPAGRSESVVAGGDNEGAATASPENSGTDSAAAPAPGPALEGNDILKKLMQQREKELK
jgi:hypothetical protein